MAYPFLDDFLSPAWPKKVRVGENSPSLCPTISSVQYTGTNFLPLCTAKVSPTDSGRMTERLDQVLITLRLPDSWAWRTFFSRWSSIKGPFFSERATVYFLLFTIYLLESFVRFLVL